MTGKQKGLRGGIAAIVAAGALMVLAVAPAGAQDADPYGATTTTEGTASFSPSCELSVTEGAPGATVVATVVDVPFGSTVRVLLGGTEVGRATAPAGTAAAGGVGATVDISFVVPVLAAGDYPITAVGVDFVCECSPSTGGMFSVLGDAVGTGADADGGSLPRTGIYVGLLLVAAGALLLVGRVLLGASRRRRRRADRQAREAARRLVDHGPTAR